MLTPSALSLCLMAAALPGAPYAWQHAPQSPGSTLAERFPPPAGFARSALPEDSFGAWLRGLPLRTVGAPVKHFDGRLKPYRDGAAAVVDIDAGRRDLQQCADAVMRLRAEYLWARGLADAVSFDFTSGHPARFSAWRTGLRPRVEGRKVRWLPLAKADASYASFRSFLDTVFQYAGTASLVRQLERVSDPLGVSPGQLFIQGGSPGHAVLVVDAAQDERGRRVFLLAQSYMPAQDVHVLKNPTNPESPWYEARSTGKLATPEWTFSYADLRRFPE